MKIIAVVVAYNRRELLAGTLDALAAQERPADAVLVVDNASSDGSGALAQAHPVVTEVLSLPRNTGGAGGFSAGIAHALMTLGAGALWLMDDDTAPTPTALAELERAVAAYPGKVAAASSRVVWTDGRVHPMNRQRSRLFASRGRWAKARQVGAVPIRTGSFVSLLVDGHVAWRHRLPRADYFIWNDDLEYSARLLRRNDGLLVPSSVVVHRTASFAGVLDAPGERFFYEVRNKIWTFFFSPAFGPVERWAYVLYTAAGWVGAIRRAPDRRALRRALARGLRAGVTKRPRSSAEVLSGLGQVSAEVTAIDTRTSWL
ncbi:MAG: glycosyltransferase [Bifidobacteriaceae bacterium]|jgi:GT2 family glycosyltransferase|nr:glycosyltransferase [Bifidobacteriaceae bacterium]